MDRDRLPLFPISTVLFPGARMPLHIFEQRYRRMVARCMASDGLFGMIYHDPDLDGPFLFDGCRVGSVARIVESRLLEDGRSLILVEGAGRFTIEREIHSDAPFYEAHVLEYEDGLRSAGGTGRVRKASLDSFMDVVRSIDCPEGEVPCFDLDQDLSFQLAPCIHIDPQWQQSLLSLQSEGARLERLDAVLQAALERDPIGDEVPP
jgi:Lon protease-like protein